MRTLALLLAGIAVVLALASLQVALSERTPRTDMASPPPWEELRAQLAEEQQARERLAARLRSLDARIAGLRAEAVSGLPPSAVDPAPGATWEGAGAALGDAPAPVDVAAPPPQGSFDEQALRAAGVPDSEVRWLRKRWEQRELDALYLRDRALREGWGMGRLRGARQRERQAFLDEVGTQSYDQMLYATGSDNRVVVRDVFRGSAAEAAGVRPGDVILGYAGSPVFEPRDLRWLTSSGEPGDSVPISLRRGRTPLELRIEIGPLGVSTEQVREPPAP